MAWKDLKRFWFKPVEINSIIEQTMAETVATKIENVSPTTIASISYAIIDSAGTRQDSDKVIHLVIGVYSTWVPEYLNKLLKKVGYTKQKVVVVVPDFLKTHLQLQDSKLEIYSIDELSKLKKKKYQLASVYVYNRDHMFNWEYYGLDLEDNGYLILDNISIPPQRTEYVPGWTVRGRFSNIYFLRRDRGNIIDNRSNDTNQGSESESTEQDVQDSGH